MSRIEVFSTPHRALRYAFGELTTKAGTTDFTNRQDVLDLRLRMHEVFTLVHSHSHHEDDICFAELDARCTNATVYDRNEHTRLHETLDELMARITGIEACVAIGQDETAAGKELYMELCLLHGEMLRHMMEEERDTQPIFWQYMSDDELQAFEHRIMAAMSPDLTMKWLTYILPSHTHNERVMMLAGAQSGMPAEAFNAVLSLAESVLRPEEYANVKAALCMVEVPMSI
ncbi:MAG: hemerythrin domain-containing protein [Candidatus Kapabacteria bacterium]|nr:hemerythrin domain-containing protein [Candidatus Kapabacteria bacterium]